MIIIDTTELNSLTVVLPFPVLKKLMLKLFFKKEHGKNRWCEQFLCLVVVVMLHEMLFGNIIMGLPSCEDHNKHM